MVSRSYEGNDYRRGAPNYRGEVNQLGHSGRDEGDYSFSTAIYGRENSRQDDRYPQRADYGYRDLEQAGRGGEASRGYQAQGNYGYGGGSEYEAGRHGGQGGARRGAGPYEDPRRGALGQGGDAGDRSGRDGSRQFDPDYHQWRDAQLNALDSDYQAGRGERYKQFADEFSQWRSGRSRSGEEGQGKSGEMENPLKSK